MSEPKLKRNLSFISMIAIASGAVIGGHFVYIIGKCFEFRRFLVIF